jgi:hypothetical protein
MPSPFWPAQTIYSIMPDRFANGNVTNDDLNLSDQQHQVAICAPLTVRVVVVAAAGCSCFYLLFAVSFACFSSCVLFL